MHDIGKSPFRQYPLKPGALTPEEFTIMKEHTIRGSEIISRIANIGDTNYAKYCYIIAGITMNVGTSGIPAGFKATRFHCCANRSIADVYDALARKRCYKEAYSPNAYRMILSRGGRLTPSSLNAVAGAQRV